MTEDRRRQLADDEEATIRAITMQDVRLAVGEGKLSAADLLAGCNAELRRRAGSAYLRAAGHIGKPPRQDDATNDPADPRYDIEAEGRDRRAAAELVKWWDTGVLGQGLVRAEASALLATGKVVDGDHVQRAERDIVNRIVRRVASAWISKKGFA